MDILVTALFSHKAIYKSRGYGALEHINSDANKGLKAIKIIPEPLSKWQKYNFHEGIAGSSNYASNHSIIFKGQLVLCHQSF